MTVHSLCYFIALSTVATDVESNIREIFDLLDTEEAREKEFQVSTSSLIHVFIKPLPYNLNEEEKVQFITAIL